MPGPPPWLPSLHHPETYPHSTADIRLIETHLSWVFLTGDWAYKLKKPVALPFVDFSTLEKRRACCEEELRLNRRTVPEIYEGVVSLVATGDGPRFAGQGEVLEYAVRMRQFPQSDVLLERLNAGQLTEDLIDSLSRSIAAMHADAARASADSSFGSPATIDRYTRECLTRIAASDPGGDARRQLQMLETWVNDTSRRLDSHFRQRRLDGFVRECHGDLHLGNLVVVQGVPRPFDCLEFNPELRFIDIVSDVAFLAMDLFDHGLPALAWRLLNGWLEQSGDFEGLKGLRYYAVYRALVRAKVAAIRLAQPGLDQNSRDGSRSQLDSYLALAVRLSEHRCPALILMHGLSGSGKSFVARRVASELDAICLRSDIERKRLAVDQADAGAASSGAGLYSPQTTARTYSRLRDLTGLLLEEGLSVIVDATFLQRAHRKAFRLLAEERGFPWAILACEAPDQVLRDRIQTRSVAGHDPSDATIDVLVAQQSQVEELDDVERRRSVLCRTDSADPFGPLGPALRSLLAGGVSDSG